MVIEQYEVFWVELDPALGAEVKKTRPCIVLSPRELNNQLLTVVIAPITSTLRNLPSRTEITLNGRLGQVMLDQIRGVDKKRLKSVMGYAKRSDIIKIKSNIQELYVD